jgi:pyruvate dehydrogenase E2 component (dihydrolipoamide acetyltransferase)
MAEVILMPRLSDTMTEGVIADWHKKVGDSIKKGDILVDIETDKATMELESYQAGTLLHIGTAKGGKLQVNDLLCIIGNANDDISGLIAATKTVASSSTITVQQPVAIEEVKVIETPPPTTPPTTTTTTFDASTMEEVVLMPRLSDTMTEGVVASWNKNVGDTVKKGEVLADIETDKATMELESYKDGILLYQGAKAGEKIIVNDLLCIIGKEGLDINSIVANIANKNNNVFEVVETKVSETLVVATAPTAQSASQSQATVIFNTGRIFASPLAKKLAKENSIDLQFVKGTGDNGRITKIDIESHLANATTTQIAVEPTSQVVEKIQTASPQIANSFTDVQVSQMRKTIARRLSDSLFTAPHFYLTMSIDMDAAVAARTKLNATGTIKISFNDMVIKATAMALQQHPKVNSSWLGDVIRYNNNINIGVAVAVEEGLLVPVVRNANTLSFSQIGSQVKDYAQKAKDKKLQPSDWEGNTFTISNLGMFGIEQFTAIINPPDACILAVGGISQEPVVKNNAIVVGNVMKVTLSCDHRVVDGATGAAFLQTLKSLLEEPLRMLA